MENYIINNKVIEVIRNKEYIFKIPSSFKPIHCTVLVEVPKESFKEGMELCLQFTDTFESHKAVAAVTLTSEVTRFSFKDAELLFERDHLLLGCKANFSGKVSLSLYSE